MTLTDLHITPARPRDLIDLHRMIGRLADFHGDVAAITLAQLQDALFGATPRAHALVARRGTAPVGYAAMTESFVLHEASLWIDIHHLFVVERQRSRGVGTALIRACTAHATVRKATRLTIGTDPDNASAIAAYRAMKGLTGITGSGPRFRIDLGTG